MVTIEARIQRVYFKEGEELSIHYSHWNHKANRGDGMSELSEGGYDFGEIILSQDEQGMIIVSKKSKDSGAKVTFREVTEVILK